MGPACRRGHRRDTAPQRRPAGGSRPIAVIDPEPRHSPCLQCPSSGSRRMVATNSAGIGDVVLSALLMRCHSAATANAYRTRARVCASRE